MLKLNLISFKDFLRPFPYIEILRDVVGKKIKMEPGEEGNILR